MAGKLLSLEFEAIHHSLSKLEVLLFFLGVRFKDFNDGEGRCLNLYHSTSMSCR